MIRQEEKRLRREDRKRLKREMTGGSGQKLFGIDQCMAMQILMGSVVLIWIFYVVYITTKLSGKRGVH